MTVSNELAAKLAIGAGGTLVGLIAGWDMGPMTLELGRTYLTLFGAVAGGLFAMTCTCWATERAEARADRERQIAKLARVTRHVGSIRSDLRKLTVK